MPNALYQALPTLRLTGRITAAILYRFNRAVYRRIRNVLDRFFVRRYDHKIIDAYLGIRKQSGTSRADHPYQGADILRVLERLRPRSIIELGSGQSTPFFCAYARRHDARFTSFDQSPFWQRIVNECTRTVADTEPVVLTKTKETPGLGGRYVRDIEVDTEFVYVDGPTVKMKTSMPAGKAVNLDVSDLLDRGGRPLAIMVEGRTDTVDYLKKNSAIQDYDFLPEFIYAHRKRGWRQALNFRRHSVFVLKRNEGD